MRLRIPTSLPPRRALGRSALLSLGMLASLCAASCSATPDPNERVKSLSQLPNRDQSLVKLGDTSRDAGDCVTAVRFYRLAIDKDSEPAELASARLGLGACELGLGDLVNAESDYQEAAKLMPQNPAPMLGLGRIYLVDHKPTQAVDALDAAIKSGASGPSPWNDKGVALDQLSRHKEAQIVYRAGLTKYPSDRPLQSNLGLSLAMSGDLMQAEALLAPLAAGPDATARNRQNLALVLGLKGDDANARDLSRRDLDGAAVDNNMRYYQRVRAEMNGAPVPSNALPARPDPSTQAAPIAPVAASALPPAAAPPEPKAKSTLAAKAPAPKLALSTAAPADIKAASVLEVAPYAAEESSPRRAAALSLPASDESTVAIPSDAGKPVRVTAAAVASTAPAASLPPGPVASSEDQTAPGVPLTAAAVAAVPTPGIASP